MRCKTYFLPMVGVFLLVTGFQINLFAQNVRNNEQPTENWLKEYSGFSSEYLYHRFDRYSKEDIARFQQKFDGLVDFEKADEWEGVYFDDVDPVGFSQFRWKKNSGFLSFYIYTCLPELRSIDYGQIAVSADSILLLPETAPDSPRRSLPVKYIKVKWNDRHYLVGESSLLAFAEKAAGIYSDSENGENEQFQRWSDFWVTGDLTQDLAGLPEFPAKYKKFERNPIIGRIISISQKKVIDQFELENRFYSSPVAVYNVKINVGKKHGVKRGLTFLIDEIEETILITEVNQNSSVGVLVRNLPEDNSEDCRGENGDEIPCPEIKKGLRVSTQVGQMYLN